MNLNDIVSSNIAAISPLVPLLVQVSTGSVTNADGSRSPAYASPGSFVGSIDQTGTLTVTAVNKGKLAVGQQIYGNGTVPGTEIIGYGTGSGGAGTYLLNQPQVIASNTFTTLLTVLGRVQALQYNDIAQLDGLNIQGQKTAIYISGEVDGLVRSAKKGGDLIITPDGRIWLVVLVLEYWPNWTKFAVTLQDGS